MTVLKFNLLFLSLLRLNRKMLDFVVIENNSIFATFFLTYIEWLIKYNYLYGELNIQLLPYCENPISYLYVITKRNDL